MILFVLFSVENLLTQLIEHWIKIAYNTSSEDAKLKSLAGLQGVAEVTKTVVANHDYNFLTRMLAVVEAKDDSIFDGHNLVLTC